MSAPPDDPLPALVARLELPDEGTGARAARRQARPSDPTPPAEVGARRPSTRWMAVFASCMVVTLVAALALTYVGLKTVRSSRAGRILATESDPAAPGFEAFVEPTPTMVVVHEVDGALRSVAVLSLNNDAVGGSVILVPPQTIVGSGPNAIGMDVVYAYTPPDEREAGARASVQQLLGIGIAESTTVDDERWATLVAPVAPLQLANPDALEGFPAGPIALGPEQVGAWLSVLGDGESDLARLYRHELVWRSWITAVSAARSDPGVVPGEVEVGLGRFVRGLANGPVTVTAMPVTEVPVSEGTPQLVVDRASIEALIAQLVPFPTGALGSPRSRVRLLDGTGDPDHVMRAAPLVVPAAAEIVVAGNADRFDYTTTQIRYHDPTQKAAAERIRTALGVGEVVDDPRPTDAFDVTIVLGNDI